MMRCCRISTASLFLLLCSAIETHAQSVFQGSVVSINDVTRQFLLSQEYGPGCTVFSLDVKTLENTVTGQGQHINFTLNIGSSFSWALTASPGNNTSEYKGDVVGGDNFWMFLKPPQLNAKINKQDKRFSIRPLTVDIGISAQFPLFVLCESEQPTEPVALCGLEDSPATVEVGVIVDKPIYDFYEGDVLQIEGDVRAHFSTAANFFEAHGVIVDWVIRPILYKVNEVQDFNYIGVQELWEEERGCVPIDIIYVFKKDGVSGGGMTFPDGYCDDEKDLGLAPYDEYPTCFIEFGNGNLIVEEGSYAEMSFVHELGHVLVRRGHLDEADYDGCSLASLPIDRAKCTNCPVPCKVPLMCDRGGGQNDLWRHTLSECTCQYIASTLQFPCFQDLRTVPPLPCSNCEPDVTITADNQNPLLGCTGEDIVNFTVELCNNCEENTFSVEISQRLDRFDLLTTGLSVTETQVNRKISYNNVILNNGECFTANFTSQVISAPNSGELYTSVDVNDIGGNLIEAGISIKAINESTAPVINEALSEENDASLGFNQSTNQTFVVDGNFVIDLDNIGISTYTFDRCALVFTPGSQITVESGQLLFKGCVLKSCDNMWNGIVVESGAELLIRETEIKDAISAVSLEKNATADIRNSTFRNNLDGVVVDLLPGETTNLAAFFGNTIVGDDNLKTPYADTWPRTGIRVDNAILSVGADSKGLNLFDGLQCGIHATNSTLSLRSTEFKNMQIPVLGQISDGAGTGVYIRNKVNQYKWLLATGIEQLHFENCEAGIDAEATMAYIHSAGMVDVGTGIRLANCQDRAIEIKDCDIYATKMGIGLLQNNPFRAYIYDNHISLNAAQLVSNPTGIKIDDNAYPGSGSTHSFNNYVVRKNMIELEHRGNGISLGTGQFIQVHDNAVMMKKEESPMQGIVLSGTQNAWVRCNGVYGPMDAIYSTNTIGVNGFGAAGTLLNCNTTDGTRYGFRFNGMGDHVHMRGNNINDHLNGLLIEGDGVIGIQDYHGNKWCGTYTDVGAKHLGIDQIVDQSPFIIDPNLLTVNSCDLLPQFQSGTQDWFRPLSPNQGQSTFLCNDLTFDACGEITSPGSPGPTDKDNDIFLQALANGTFQADRYQSALEWTGRKHLYENLDRNQSATASWEQTFMNVHQYSSVGLFAAIDANLGNLLSLSQADGATLQQIEYRQQSSLEALASLEAPETGGSYADHLALLDSLSQQQLEGEQIMQSIHISRSSSLNTLKHTNNFIGVDSIYEQNEKQFNTVFLTTIAKGETPELPTDVSTLWSIANQCPLSGGDAVFKARSAYRLIDPLVAFDDDALCGQAQPLAIPTEKETLSFALYPNPAKDIVVVQFSETLKSNAEIVLMDAQGKAILQMKAEPGQQSLLLDTSTLSPGLYFCEVKGTTTTSNTEKLVIIR